MTDIVDQLRDLAAIDNCQTSIEAADEITRLRAENERLRAANETWAIAYHAEYYANERLRAALKPILNYPNIREKIGNQLYDLGCAALKETGHE